MINSKVTKNLNFLPSKDIDVSVLIPTYNRAEDLRLTLDTMKNVNRKSISVEFVVIDNGSTDHTKLVVGSFNDLIPIRYLYEPRAGKNCALNFALNNAPLGEITVFTDDDIEADPEWLHAIVETCKRWPDHSVFGGRIYVVWPHENIPDWANEPHIQGLGFTAHSISDHECVYDQRYFPFGPNFWVRSQILNNGRRYDETIGPKPSNRIMGSESSFLLNLREDGYEFVYSPYPFVGHRIQPEVLTVTGIWRRAFRLGRSFPHLRGLPDRDQLEKHPLIWRLFRFVTIIKLILRIIASILLQSSDQRVIRVVYLIQKIGRDIESLRIAGNRTKIKEIISTN